MDLRSLKKENFCLKEGSIYKIIEVEDYKPAELCVWINILYFNLNSDVKKTRKIKTVVEEVVDGKVVSSEVQEMEESI